MKIKTKKRSYEEVISALEKGKKVAFKPKKPNIFFRTLVRLLSAPELISVGFECERVGMERLGKKEPCLILMNHSSFIDMKIAYGALYPRAFNIVCTEDTFIGKAWLIKQIGGIPTRKFVPDMGLLRNIKYSLNTLGSSVLMYPEAGYTVDGRSTALPDSLGGLLKMLKAPVVMIRTEGAFLRDPLYNNLRKRKVKVTATMKYLVSPEEIKERSAEDLNQMIKEEFSFDGFRHQQENGININAPFRTDFLHRVLYKCPECGAEGEMLGKGIQIKCRACGKVCWLDEEGFLDTFESKPRFSHIPDWLDWEREEVRRELAEGRYVTDMAVDIYVQTDRKAIYSIGEGRLVHNRNGFLLTGCNGSLEYAQKPLFSHSVCVDFNWYELGDVVCVGNMDISYYCVAKDPKASVLKVRLAAEEMYVSEMKQKRGKNNSGEN